jgi:hypothetical protein
MINIPRMFSMINASRMFIIMSIARTNPVIRMIAVVGENAPGGGEQGEAS